MSTQRSNSAKKFSIQKTQTKLPFHLLHRKKVSHLQSKAQFFEGQVDPLQQQNTTLKEQLIRLTKISAMSCQILKNLIVEKYSSNPSKKLKAQLSNLLDISEMIKEEWELRELNLVQNSENISKLTEELNSWHCLYDQEHAFRLSEVRQLEEINLNLQEEHREQIVRRDEEKQEMISKHEEEKQKIKQYYLKKLDLYENGIQEYQKFQRQTAKKTRQYEGQIVKLKGQIEANIASFEEGKKNLKEIYDKLMTERIEQQKEGYELMMKGREEQKLSLMMVISENEEEHKRQLALKEYQITKLNELKMSYFKQIESLKEQLWNRDLTISKHQTEQKALNQRISTSNNINENLLSKIDRLKKDNEQQRNSYDEKLAQSNNMINKLKKDANMSQANALAEKQRIQKQLQELEQKHKEIVSAYAKAEAIFNTKVQKMKNQWFVKQQEYKKTISDTKIELEQHLKIIEESKLQNKDLLEAHTKNINDLKSIFEQREEDLAYRYEKRINLITTENELNIDSLQKRHQQVVQQAKIEASKQLQDMLINCNKKLTLQAEEHNNMVLQMMAQKQSIKAELNNSIEQKNKQENQNQLLRIKHTKAIKQIEEKHQSQQMKFSQELNQQLLAFQKTLMEKEMQMSDLKEEMNNQIKMLKDDSALSNLQAKNKSQIKKLMAEFDKKIKELNAEHHSVLQTLLLEHQKKIQALENSKYSFISSIKEMHKIQIHEIAVRYNDNLVRVIEKAQQSQKAFKSQLFTGFDSDFEGSSPEEKIQYIVKKISHLQSTVSEKDEEITNLISKLFEFQSSFQSRIKGKRQEMELEKEIALKNCNEKVSKAMKQCKGRVDEVQRSRLEHAKQMEFEFVEMRKTHEQQISLLRQKYREVEKLFEERPSRIEDLTKIKQLINIKANKEFQIQNFKKRMETANQIVKYLNLQLQNYKNAYDIFGPQQDNKQIGLVGQTLRQSHQHSNSDTETLKMKKFQKSESQSKPEEVTNPSKDPLSFRKFNDISTAKELKLFDESSQDFDSRLKPMRTEGRQKKYSYLTQKPEKRERIKTQKNQQTENEVQMVAQAQQFIKLLKGGELTNQVIRQEREGDRKKSYRKRKPQKKNTIGASHFV